MSVKEKTNTQKRKVEKVNPVTAFLWKDKKRRAKNFYFILVAFLCVMTVGMGYITEKLDLMDTGDDTVITGENAGVTNEVIFEEEDLEIMQAIDSAGSLNDFLYQWANNDGELYSSKNVINILLVGLDSKDALENGGRSDSLILVSLNKKTEKISMCSFFRDSWCYMNLAGKDSWSRRHSHAIEWIYKERYPEWQHLR